MIENLGSHRLPPALMQAVKPDVAEEIIERNRAPPKRRKSGASPQYAECKRWQDRKAGKIPAMQYYSLDEALRIAGLRT